MTEIEALVGLNLVMDIGSIRLKRLLEAFGTPQNILSASRDKLMGVDGIGEIIASRIVSLDKKAIDRELSLARKNNVRILFWNDLDYPRNLKFIYDPPIVIYLKGQLLPRDNLGLAIVGSRRASFYGLSCAEKFSGDLVANGFTVISGMARGIDTAAHKGAIKARGRTIAVIGSGILNIYPQENQKLAEQIASNGAVVSEFPVEAQPLKQNFPRRNRLISGLSLGVLVVEACRNSGALITSHFALEQGREVFAIPGKVDSVSSFGTNSLIQQGAKLVSGIEDILEEFPFFAVQNHRESLEEGKRSLSPQQGLSCTEELLYNIISTQASSVDEVVQKTGLAIGEISLNLLSLQLKKKIRVLAGKLFERVKNGR
ncbi:MAG: DNA-processing protein DprA [Candidatus Omnitrophica bacterium]|nr:DNA-processing protein DprA [Candidatus Omnitrophota bacterium]